MRALWLLRSKKLMSSLKNLAVNYTLFKNDIRRRNQMDFKRNQMEILKLINKITQMRNSMDRFNLSRFALAEKH